jgi:hypothetical protein
MEIDNFEKFWLHYLHEHARPETRDMHLLGTGLAGLLLATAVLSSRVDPQYRPISPLKLVAAAAIAGYGPAWISHIFYEGNRPVTFRHPAWSLLADLRMVWLSLNGKLERELRIAGVEIPTVDAASQLSATGR